MKLLKMPGDKTPLTIRQVVDFLSTLDQDETLMMVEDVGEQRPIASPLLEILVSEGETYPCLMSQYFRDKQNEKGNE